MDIESIEKSNIEKYSSLILPYILDDYRGSGRWTETAYFGLGAAEGKERVSALIMQPEITGDLNIVSLYTVPGYRRKGYASALLNKSIAVARELFRWEKDETEELIVLKTLYSLPGDILDIYESFLIKNHFTDFVLLKEAAEREEEVWSASCEIKFFKERKGTYVPL